MPLREPNRRNPVASDNNTGKRENTVPEGEPQQITNRTTNSGPRCGLSIPQKAAVPSALASSAQANTIRTPNRSAITPSGTVQRVDNRVCAEKIQAACSALKPTPII